MIPLQDLLQYYADKAQVYDKTYMLAQYQQDVTWLKARLQTLLKGHDVLEVACGTGYWTAAIAETARLITATDLSYKALQVAQRKIVRTENVQLLQEDAFSLRSIQGRFSAGFAGFWWSHIAKSQLPAFLDVFHSKIIPGGLVVFADNCYVEGAYYPIARTDHEGNSYQQRKLRNGKTYEVLKNFPSKAELERVLSTMAKDLQYEHLTYYWCLSYYIC